MRMAKLSPIGVLVVSLDLELPVQQLATADRRALDAITPQLIQTFDRLKVPATWSVADPVHSVATDRLLSSGLGHEIAISGDATWVGAEVTRSRFFQELSRRVVRARAAGLPASTLVVAREFPSEHLDLVVKQGVTALRTVVDAAGGAAQPAQPRSPHFGLWEIPGSLRLPGETRWLAGRGRGWKARALLNRAVQSASLVHLVVDAAQLGVAGRPALRTLERVLQHVDQLRASGGLEVLTLGEVAARLSQTPHHNSAHSILRKAG